MESVIENFEEWAHLRRRQPVTLPEGTDWFHGQSQAPADQPVTVRAASAAQPQEETIMSLSADMHALAARLETIGEEAVTKLEAVAANPATAEVFGVLHQLTGLNLDPNTIREVATGLKTLVNIYTPDPQPAVAAPAQ